MLIEFEDQIVGFRRTRQKLLRHHLLASEQLSLGLRSHVALQALFFNKGLVSLFSKDLFTICSHHIAFKLG